jgi:hypothetical protein
MRHFVYAQCEWQFVHKKNNPSHHKLVVTVVAAAVVGIVERDCGDYDSDGDDGSCSFVNESLRSGRALEERLENDLKREKRLNEQKSIESKSIKLDQLLCIIRASLNVAKSELVSPLMILFDVGLFKFELNVFRLLLLLLLLDDGGSSSWFGCCWPN